MPDPDHVPDLDVTVRVAAPNPSTGTRQEPDIPQPEELAALLPGDNYTVESFLGAGGMGAVYKGTQVRLQRKVAIKIMRRDRAKDQGFEERFRREALAMAQLNHPNIVNVIDYGEAGADYLYIVMEFIDGTDLVNVIRSGQMTQETALKLLPQICDALQFAHDHGIVHRDIKPANILLTRDGRIKMADFGLAKRFDAENSYRTQSGYGMGTPDYAAPEQFMGDASVDHRADIYALGVMIYQMITGTLPRGAWKPPSEKAAVDAFWDHIVARALQTDPHDRYASVSEIKTDLSGITPTTGAPRLAAEGTQVGKTAGMTAAKASTTALTQAGGRPVTKAGQATLQNDNPQSNSGRKRGMTLSIAAIVLLAGGYLARDKFKTAPMTTGSNFAAARTWQAPAPTVTAGTEWTHLVPHIKPERDAIRGEWSVDEKGLHAKPYEWAFCNIPVQDPGTDYDLRYQVTRGEGSHLAVFFAFRKGSTGGYVPIDYNGGGGEFADGKRWATIEDLTNRDMRDPATIKAKRREWLPRGKTCTVLLQVRDKEVIVYLDDKEVFRTPADWSRLGQGGGIGKMRFGDLTGETIFGVGVYDCHATFHSIEMRRVSETNASASASTPATKDTPFINSLGMKFVPVPISGGPTDGKRLLFSVWETRVQDYEMFVKETKRTWMKPPFDQDPTHPAVNVNWLDAVAFCAWLTGRERTAGRLGTQEVYRLPSDHEWSCAAGMGGREDAASPPQQKTHNLADVFLWGSEWPPPPGAGNFHGEEMDGVLFFKTQGILKGYWDGFARTAPTGSFPPNSLGLFDLSGNVSEYCEDWYDATQKSRVTRGASWGKNLRNELSLAFRDKHPPNFQNIILGFRSVIAPSGSNAAVSPPPSQQVSSSSVATATKEAPFVNSLGMRFVPMPITGGPTDGKRMLFSVWETRVQDYEVFVKETKHEWPKAPFEQGPAHPAVNINWHDAAIFCTWLTNKERTAGTIGPQDKYRLPSDHEWSCAAGIGDLEDSAKSPSYKNRGAHALADEPATANFSGAETAEKKMFANQMAMENHRDDHPYTAPVASFLSNPLGLYDMAGNVAEWCDDLYYQTDEPGDKQRRTFRGSTFVTASRVKIGARSSDTPNNRAPMRGMRVALEVSTGAPRN